MQRRTQEQRSAETQRRLLDATIKLLLERGYTRLTTPEIAAAAGVSRGALTHHFANKEDIVASAIEHQLRLAILDIRAFAERLDGADSQSDQVVDYLWQVMSDGLFYTTLEYLPEARHNDGFRGRLIPVVREFHAALDMIWALVSERTGTDLTSARLLLNTTMCLIRGMIAQTVLRDDSAYYRELLDSWKATLRTQFGSLGAEAKDPAARPRRAG